MPATASVFQVAQYKVDDPTLGGGNAFSFTNAGPGSSLSQIGDSVHVDFEYTITANTYNGLAGAIIPAEMTFSAGVAGPASQTTVGLQTLDVQPMSDMVITITADTPMTGLNGGTADTNLLTLTVGSTGLTYGVDGGAVANIKGDNGGTPADTVTLSSDFVDFTGATQEAYDLELTNVTPGVTITNSYLSSFNATGAGDFDANANTGALSRNRQAL